MKINVIHNPENKERGVKMFSEILRQTARPLIVFWPAIYDTPTCKGISRAHKQIVRAHLNEPEVIIMEDDVRIPSEKGLEYFLENKPDDFDLYLSGVYTGSPKDGIVKTFSGLHLYIVNQRFYETFLKADENKPLDRGLAGKGLFKVCYPYAAIQYNGYSENTGREENYDSYLKGRKIYGL